MAGFRLEVGYSTDVGRLRERNEDSYAIFSPSIDDRKHSPLGGMLLVADGMGGERAGDRASQMAAEGLHQCFASQVFQTWPEYRQDTWLSAVLQRAIRDVSDAILQLGKQDESVKGLGSTVVLTLLVEDHMTIAHVGDSRCYRVRDGRIELLTADHTWVERQVAAGVLSPEQARHHPQRNVLVRSLGDSPAPAGDLRTEKLQDGDLFLLCSDGLTGEVSDSEILAQTRLHQSAQQLSESLVRLANYKDGSDNVTVVVGRVSELLEAHR